MQSRVDGFFEALPSFLSFPSNYVELNLTLLGKVESYLLFCNPIVLELQN